MMQLCARFPAGWILTYILFAKQVFMLLTTCSKKLIFFGSVGYFAPLVGNCGQGMIHIGFPG